MTEVSGFRENLVLSVSAGSGIGLGETLNLTVHQIDYPILTYTGEGIERKFNFQIPL